MIALRRSGLFARAKSISSIADFFSPVETGCDVCCAEHKGIRMAVVAIRSQLDFGLIMARLCFEQLVEHINAFSTQLSETVHYNVNS